MKALDFRRFYGLNFGPFYAQDGFREEDHPRAAAGGSKGGQFTSGGGNGSSSGSKAEGKKGAKPEAGKKSGAAKKYPIAPKGTWYGEENYESTGGKMVEMSPEEFLKKARPLDVDESSRENIDELKARMEKGEPLDPLNFNEKTGKEDGRHRAIAAKELGIEKVPVIVWPKESEKPAGEKPGAKGAERTPSTAGEKLFNSTHNPKITRADILAKFPPDTQAKLDSAKAKIEQGVPTDAPVERGGFKMANGQYTPEREQVQRRILEKTFSPEKIKAATPAPGEKPTATFLGGRGGSGKTWLTKSENAPVDATKAIVLNSDDFKEALPEYHGWNAGLLHEEATDILNRSLDLAKRMGVNIVLDATMKSEGGIGRYVADFREAGYNLEGYYMHASPETAATRAVERFLRGGDKGRYVPPELILSSTTNEKVFDKVSQFMRKWAIYDNNTGGGSAPKFVAKGENKLDE